MHLISTNRQNLFAIKVVFLFIFLLPSFLYVSLSLSSMSYGILLIGIMTLIFGVKKISLSYINLNKLIILISIFIFHFFLGFFLFENYLNIKKLMSLFLILILLISSSFMATSLIRFDDTQAKKMLRETSYLMLFIGIFALFYRFEILNYSSYAKSVFPFAEPSHYAITASSILFAVILQSKKSIKYLIILLMLIMSLMLPSALLLVLTFVFYMLSFKINIVKSVFKTVLLIFLAVFILEKLNLSEYFFDRFSINSDSKNLTALVYLQGWDDMKTNLLSSYGFGIGFQNMGNYAPSKLSEVIYALSGRYLNREDGGFLASKLISEFGLLGIFVVFIYLVRLYKSIFFIIGYVRIMSSNNPQTKISPIVLFGHATIVVFFIEMFGRGYGYFSPGIFILFVAIFIISANKFVFEQSISI